MKPIVKMKWKFELCRTTRWKLEEGKHVGTEAAYTKYDEALESRYCMEGALQNRMSEGPKPNTKSEMRSGLQHRTPAWVAIRAERAEAAPNSSGDSDQNWREQNRDSHQARCIKKRAFHLGGAWTGLS